MPLHRVLIALLLSGACASMSRRAAAPAPSSRATGSYAASLALTGRSTYTGVLTLTSSSSDSVRGSLRLTSPITVDVTLSGLVRGDSLLLGGGYSGSNDCAGDLKASLVMPTDRSAAGPFQLADKCAGALSGVMTVSR
jgi:hypothetical protein